MIAVPKLSDGVTFFFALVGVGRSDYGAFVVDDHDALNVLVGLHAVQRLLHLRHSNNLISIEYR